MADQWEAYWILVGLLNEENRKAVKFMRALLKDQKR